MSDLPDTLEIGGKQYRTEAGHERALHEAILKVAGNGSTPTTVAGKESGLTLDVIATRLDLIAKAFQSLGQNKQLVEQFDSIKQTVYDGEQRLEKQHAAAEGTVCQMVGAVLKRLENVQQDVRGLEDLKEDTGAAERVLCEMRAILEEVRDNQTMLLELLDAATRPPERVTPRLQPRLLPPTPMAEPPPEEVPAEDRPLPGPLTAEQIRAMDTHGILAYLMQTPSVTLEDLAHPLGISPQGVSYRLYQVARQCGVEEALKERLRQGMGKRSRSGAVGSVAQGSTPAGMS